MSRGSPWTAGAGKLLANGGSTRGNAAAALGKEKPKEVKEKKNKRKKRKERKN